MADPGIVVETDSVDEGAVDRAGPGDGHGDGDATEAAGAVAERPVPGSGAMFHDVRVLTSDRTTLFERTAALLAEKLQEELGRWVGEAIVQFEPLYQTSGFEHLELDRCDLAVFRSQFSPGFGLVATDLSLSMALISVLCGGTGGEPAEVRPLTRLEIGVVDLVLQPVVGLAVELFELGSWELTSHLSAASGLPHAAPGEAVVAVPLHLAAAGVEGTMRVVMTSTQLQTYIEGLDRRIAGQYATRTEPCVEIVRAVRPVPVELVAGFEPMRVPAAELAGLQVGDVIRTRQSVSRPLIARVGDERLFHFRPGQRGQRLIAEVTGHVQPGRLGAGDIDLSNGERA